MKKWQCSVCKYIHEGDTPPEKCPICGVGPEKFVLLPEISDGPESANPSSSPNLPLAQSEKNTDPGNGSTASGSEKWICTVCKHVHQGTEPPDVCPICGVPKEKFREDGVPFEEGSGVSAHSAPAKNPGEEDPSAAPEKNESESKRNGFFSEQILKHHLHPMTVHVPNGVIPVAVLFVLGAALLQAYALVEAAFYNLVAVLLSMPIVWISGVVEWRKRYSGVWTSRFVTKIVCGILAPACALVLAVWYKVQPNALEEGSGSMAVILVLNGVMLAATSLAGFVGGKFVFKD